MEIKEQLYNTPSARVYLVTDDGKEAIYKEFKYQSGVVENNKYAAFVEQKTSRIVFPRKLEKEGVNVVGHYTDYIEGETLDKTGVGDRIDFDELIEGFRILGTEYDEIATKGILVKDVNLANLIYSNGKLFNIDVDSFSVVDIKIRNEDGTLNTKAVPVDVIKMKNRLALKQVCSTLVFNNITLPAGIRKVFDKDLHSLMTPADVMLYDLKHAMELEYGKTFNTLSIMRNRINGVDDIGDNSNSRTYRGR